MRIDLNDLNIDINSDDFRNDHVDSTSELSDMTLNFDRFDSLGGTISGIDPKFDESDAEIKELSQFQSSQNQHPNRDINNLEINFDKLDDKLDDNSFEKEFITVINNKSNKSNNRVNVVNINLENSSLNDLKRTNMQRNGNSKESASKGKQCAKVVLGPPSTSTGLNDNSKRPKRCDNLHCQKCDVHVEFYDN